MLKKLTANTREADWIPGSGISPGERSGNPLQYSCLGNAMNRGVWWATVYGVTEESDTTMRLNNNNPSTPPSVSENKMSGSFDYWTIAM